MDLDRKDVALQKSCPVMPVPRFTPFQPLNEPGERILVASNGTFIEIKRKWGYFIRNVGAIATTVPFGQVQPATVLHTTKLPTALLERFVAMAKADCDVEIGASIVWDEATAEFTLLRSVSIESGPGNLMYQLPPLEPTQHIVIDCHSHAHYNAYFSKTDDMDDAHAVRFSFVVGNCNQVEHTTSMRLCVKGTFENIEMKNTARD